MLVLRLLKGLFWSYSEGDICALIDSEENSKDVIEAYKILINYKKKWPKDP